MLQLPTSDGAGRVVHEEEAENSQEESERLLVAEGDAGQSRDEEQLEEGLTDSYGQMQSATEKGRVHDLGSSNGDDSDCTNSSDDEQVLEEERMSTANRAFLPHRDVSSSSSHDLGRKEPVAVAQKQMDAGVIRQRVKQSIEKKRKLQSYRPTRTKREAKQKTEKKRMQREAEGAMKDW